MASAAADRLDVTTWIPVARSASAPRSGWEAAGIAARAGDSSQDRFGAALSAAQARDDAAATRVRAADQRDATEAARSRQADQREQADAARQAADRARDAAAKAEARTADRKAGLDQQADGPAPVPSTPAAGTAESTRTTAQAPSRPTPAAGNEKAVEPQSSADAATAPDPAAASADAALPAATQTDPPALPQKAEPAPQTAAVDPTASLLAIIAALSEGGAAHGAPSETGAAGAEPASGAGAAKDGIASATAGIPGPATSQPGGVAPAGSHPHGALSGISAVGSGTAVSASAAPADKVGVGDATPQASGTAGPDFLTALADVGQGAGAGSLQASPPAAQGGLGATAASGQATGTTSAAQGTAAPSPATAPAQTDPPVPIGQVPMTIGLRSLRGSNEFQIRLDPAELGRIDVKLEIDKAQNRVMTHLVVDRPETLALLQRDAGQLQQALSQAGLDPSASGLNLSLRSDGGAQSGGGSGQQGAASRGSPAGRTRDQVEAPQEIAPTRWLRGYGGVDMRI
jgi:flagellar hook-length control protein FliK